MTLLESFSGIEDPRRAQGLRTSLEQVLSMVVLSYLCGYTGYRPVASFSKEYEEILTEELSLRHGVPSHVTFRAVLMHVDHNEMIRAFNNWANSFVKNNDNLWISGDGKVLGSTLTDAHGSGQDFEAIVSMFVQETGLVYSLEHYRNKTKKVGEQSMVRFLVNELKGMGAIICLDALHSQKKQLTRL